MRLVILNFQSMKFRIIALGFLLVMIGVVLRFFFAVPLIEKRVQELAEAQQMSMASYVAQKIDTDLQSRLTLIQRFATALPVALLAQPDALDAWIQDRQSVNPAFDVRMIVIRADGHGVLASYPVRDDILGYDFSTQSWFKEALKGNSPVMSAPLPAVPSRGAAIIFAAPVHDAGGNVVAVLIGVSSISQPGFLDHLQTAQLGATGGFLLVSPADHLFVAASDPTMSMKPTPPVGVNMLHDRAMAGFRGAGVTINARGVEELSAIATVPTTGWFVVARMPTVEALRPVTTLRHFIVVSNVVLAITTLAILFIMLPRILRPLTHTARAIRDMADGKIAIAQLPVERDDEVGKLVSGFNVLVSRLKREEVARKAGEARLRFLAHHDYLTGLYNRATLEERLARALVLAEQDRTQLALLFCDLDGFKVINDQYGHETGDAVLQQVAGRLSEGCSQVDTVARLGGDEFVILLIGLNNARTAATAVAQQFVSAIAAPFYVDTHALTLGISIGIALQTKALSTPERLMERADAAMYQAKRDGKGRFFVDDLES